MGPILYVPTQLIVMTQHFHHPVSHNGEHHTLLMAGFAQYPVQWLTFESGLIYASIEFILVRCKHAQSPLKGGH